MRALYYTLIQKKSQEKSKRRRITRRLSLSKKSKRTFLTSCLQIAKSIFVVLFCNFDRCGGLLNAKGNPSPRQVPPLCGGCAPKRLAAARCDGSLSHYSSLRNFRLDRFFDSLQKASAKSGCFFILKNIHEARFLKTVVQPFKEDRQPGPARNGVAQLRHGDACQYVVGDVLLGKERGEKHEN